ncbi:MAG: hypothetical protein NTW06_01135 [Candidatus Falkowbacteria bacterium]|nr:hypothetical protein [Candidatus Falkowbacteria bacterium]
MHIAFGSAGHGEEEANGFHQDVDAHHDFVLPRHGLTVEMFTSEKDYDTKKNGRRIISEGGFNLL